jgi:hypothetical protein
VKNISVSITRKNAVVASFDAFFSATVKEAVADVEITKEEKIAKTGARTARPRTVKAAVLNSLTSQSGQRTYDRAINDFVQWYCSEPRLAFNRKVTWSPVNDRRRWLERATRWV